MALSRVVRNPGGYLRDTLEFYRVLLTDPERFYDDFIGVHGVAREFLILLLVGAVGVAGNFYALGRLESVFETLEVPLSQDATFALWQSVLGPVLGIVALWLGLTTALYLVSWLYSGLGEYYVLLKRTAWALVPLVFANLLTTVATAFAASSLQPGDVDATAVPRPAGARAEFVWNQVATEPVVAASVLVGVVFALWTGYIAAYAVRDVRSLATDEAFRVAAVPTVAYALYVLYQGAAPFL